MTSLNWIAPALSTCLLLVTACTRAEDPIPRVDTEDPALDTGDDPSLPVETGDTGVAPGCDNGVRDSDETDVDCGGSCDPCANDLACGVNGDCASGRCEAGTCAACTASDQCDEGSFCDLGLGVCFPLRVLGEACGADGDCGVGLCVDGVCCEDACEGACRACSMAAGGQSDGACTPAFVDALEPAVCDDTVGSCGDDICACNDVGECVPNFVAEISVGVVNGCARSADGTLRCWGDNLRGQLGVEDTERRGDDPGEMGTALPFVRLGTGRSATAVSAGSRYACAILDDGSVKCWGGGGRGQLGQGSSAEIGDTAGSTGDALLAVDLGTGRSATGIATGQEHVCAILDDATLKCWGANDGGELGLGDTVGRGDDPGEMGDALAAVDLGSGRTARRISLGSGHTCAILDDGSLKCWGENEHGELGLGDTEPRGDEPGEMGDDLPALDLGTGRSAVEVAAGGDFVCAILDDGSVKCWGNGAAGSLGQGDTESRGDGPGEMGDALPPVDLGAGRTARHLATTFGSVCALLDDGQVKCWGNNSAGQLGRGDQERVGDQAGEMGDALSAIDLGSVAVDELSGRGSLFCALFVDDTVKCWGANQAGQLGLGDTERRGDDPGEMGDALPVLEL